MRPSGKDGIVAFHSSRLESCPKRPPGQTRYLILCRATRTFWLLRVQQYHNYRYLVVQAFHARHGRLNKAVVAGQRKEKPIMTTLHTGDPAPDFSAPDQNGNSVNLADFKNRKLFIFFYPKANTSG